VAANFRNRISMQPMRSRDMACRVLLFFFLVGGREWSGVEGGFFCFQGVIGEESGQSTLHCSFGQRTVDFPCKLFLGFFGGRASGRGGRLKQRLPKFLTCFPKSSQ
jgi:hypothetical protein